MDSYLSERKLVRLVTGTTHPLKQGITTGFAALKTGAITAFADGGGGQVVVTSAGHSLANGDAVTIAGTTSYNGNFTVSAVTTDTFQITDTFVADDATGTWQIDNVVVVTSPYHGLTEGETITISGTTSYNGTFTAKNITQNTFNIIGDFVADDATGTWLFTVPAASCFPFPKLRTGTITAQGKVIVGVGTAFTTELNIGQYIFAVGVVRRISQINSDDMLLVEDIFPSAVSAVALYVTQSAEGRSVKITNTHASNAGTVQEAALSAGRSVERNFEGGQAPVSYNADSAVLEINVSDIS